MRTFSLIFLIHVISDQNGALLILTMKIRANLTEYLLRVCVDSFIEVTQQPMK